MHFHPTEEVKSPTLIWLYLRQRHETVRAKGGLPLEWTGTLRHVVTSNQFIDRLEEKVVGAVKSSGAEILCLEDIRKGIGKWELLRTLLAVRLRLGRIRGHVPKVAPDQPAVVLFTSGSEKAPKAVPLTHHNLLSNQGVPTATVRKTAPLMAEFSPSSQAPIARPNAQASQIGAQVPPSSASLDDGRFVSSSAVIAQSIARRKVIRTPLLHSCLPGLWAIALTLPLSATAQETESPKDYKPLTDLFRDPLPVGAVARLGTTRWRYADGIRLIHFLENGKQLLVCSGDGVIHITDVATGRALRRFGTGDHCHLAAITPDGATLAQVRWQTDKEHISTEVVHVWDVAAGKQVCSIYPDFNIWGLHFVAGKGLLGWRYLGVIKVWDSRTGKLRHAVADEKTFVELGWEWTPENGVCHPDIRGVAVSKDGQTVAFNNSGWKKRGAKRELEGAFFIWNLNDQKPTTTIDVNTDDARESNPAFSPEGRHVAWPESDGTIQLYESATLKKARMLGKKTKEGRVRAVCFSDDGKTLAAITRSETIRLIDIATGRELREIGQRAVQSAPMWESRFLCLSPDSKRIAQAWGPGTIRVWDVETGTGNDVAFAHFGPISGMLVSPDGKAAVTLGGDNTTRTWDVDSATEQRRVSLPPTTTVGHLLGTSRALLQKEDGSLSVWDIENNTHVFEFRPAKDLKKISQLQFSRVGKRLAAVQDQSELWGKIVQFELDTGVQRAQETSWAKKGEWGEEHLLSVATATRGTSVVASLRAVYKPDPFSLSNLKDRDVIRFKQSQNDPAVVWEATAADYWDKTRAISLTPDDRAVVTINWSERNQRAIKPWLSLLESMTGKERWRLEMHIELSGRTHAFSKKGELLALATADRSTAVVDVRRGKIIVELKGDQGPVCGLAFGADAATLLTAGSEGTVLIWNLREQIAKAQKVAELSDGDVGRLWTELANVDSIKAYQALGSLLAGSDQVVSFLGDKLKPAKSVSNREIDLLIADLGSEAFKTRQRATRLLLEILPQSKAALTRSLEKRLPLEHHRRIAHLVAELRRHEEGRPEDHRELRAIEVLEAIATPNARRILRSLATGHPAARLTDQAAAALERMAP